mmetsp:Transcript_138656/g.360380  ORF Transcript_138656/g.360380 Transcript_138656/m.360380 type:complete len:159 (+) Transcript_138656:1308-1784(+)
MRRMKYMKEASLLLLSHLTLAAPSGAVHRQSTSGGSSADVALASSTAKVIPTAKAAQEASAVKVQQGGHEIAAQLASVSICQRRGLSSRMLLSEIARSVMIGGQALLLAAAVLLVFAKASVVAAVMEAAGAAAAIAAEAAVTAAVAAGVVETSVTSAK